MTRVSICFVAPLAWGVLSRDRHLAVVGGAEVQQVTLARELARRGHTVSMVCLDHGQPDGVEVDGVRVWHSHRPDAGVPGLRFLHPRLTGVWRAMARADAEVYYQRNAGALTGFVAAFARRHGRRALYAGASNVDFDPRLPHIAYARDRALFRWGLAHMDALVTQHPAQQRLCREATGRDSVVIRSAYGHRGEDARHDGDVLWVGSIKPVKAPEAFVDLARACPELRFRMVGGGDAAQVAALKDRARGLDNLVFTGFVPHAEVEAQFDGAMAIVNTSPAEGFPNTFLQAWSRGMPSLSFFDPDLHWQGRAAGKVVPDVAAMAQTLRAWRQSSPAWHQAGDDCRAVFDHTFGVDAAVDRYEALFDCLLQGKASGAAMTSLQP